MRPIQLGAGQRRHAAPAAAASATTSAVRSVLPCRSSADQQCSSAASSCYAPTHPATHAATGVLAAAVLLATTSLAPPPAALAAAEPPPRPAALHRAPAPPPRVAPLADVADVATMYAERGEAAGEALDHEADLSQEVEQPQELYDFLKLFAEGTPTDEAKLEAARLRVGFRRAPDGRISIRSSGGEWFAVKNDGMVPGFLLLRDGEGYCFYLPPDQAGALAQIDLSDDLVVAQLFANQMWEQLLEPLEVIDGNTNTPTSLRMAAGDWRGSVSLLDGAVPGEEQPLPPLDDGNGERPK